MFPSITWGFAGTTLSRMPDKELGFACVQAYNDWAVEQWAGSHPDRFIPCALSYLADAELAAKEIYRNAERGVHAVSFTENPAQLGFPSVHSDHWEPFWRACAETETAINLHIGSSGRISCPSPDTPVPAQVALFPLNGIETVVDWIFSGIPQRYNDIHIVLSEAGISWVPMVVERLHRAYRQREAEPEVWAGFDNSPCRRSAPQLLVHLHRGSVRIPAPRCDQRRPDDARSGFPAHRQLLAGQPGTVPRRAGNTADRDHQEDLLRQCRGAVSPPGATAVHARRIGTVCTEIAQRRAHLDAV